MIKIREIEKTISKLPPQKFAAFRRWFEKFDATYQEILKAEQQIKRKEVAPWSEVKRKHGL